MPCRMAIPRSSIKARIWLMIAVRCDTSRSRPRCNACTSARRSWSRQTRRALHGLGNRFGIIEVVLLSLAVGADVFGRHQPGIVTKRCEFAVQVMCADARFHADEATRHIGESCFYLATRPLLPQHDGAARIVAHDVVRVFADIDANHGDRSIRCRHGVAPCLWRPCQLRLVAGLDRGRSRGECRSMCWAPSVGGDGVTTRRSALSKRPCRPARLFVGWRGGMAWHRACCSLGVDKRARAAWAVIPCQLLFLLRSHLRRLRY
ncbi:hypothetical protein ACVW1C_005980 [Bradyrhizobium sp. USDA 4011]